MNKTKSLNKLSPETGNQPYNEKQLESIIHFTNSAGKFSEASNHGQITPDIAWNYYFATRDGYTLKVIPEEQLREVVETLSNHSFIKKNMKKMIPHMNWEVAHNVLEYDVMKRISDPTNETIAEDIDKFDTLFNTLNTLGTAKKDEELKAATTAKQGNRLLNILERAPIADPSAAEKRDEVISRYRKSLKLEPVYVVADEFKTQKETILTAETLRNENQKRSQSKLTPEGNRHN